ncbi:MAG: efflux RND transporter permease subunit [Desulfomonilaceae bacterium]
MNIAESSVRYPITVIVRVLLVIVFGYVCLNFLTVELKPDTEEPILLVTTLYPGAAPEEVEGEITTQFEQAISGVSNMVYMQSLSLYGQSQITIFYTPGTILDLAASELQRNISRVTTLPPTVQNPQIFKASDQVALPVYQFSLTGKMDLVSASTWADKDIVPRILRLSGVGQCIDEGNLTRQMNVVFDPQRMKARRLSVNDIKGFIDKTNFNQSGGYFVQGIREYTTRTVGELLNESDFGKVVVSKPGDPVVYLSDIADLQDSYNRPDSYCRINGERGIIFNVLSSAGANILKTISLIDHEVKLLERDYGPRGAKFENIFDCSNYIRDAVSVVKESLVEAIMLVLVVLFVFLKNWRSIFIVATSIPVSLVGTFIAMYLGGYSINVLSLAGLALSVGMIVDDAIVVLENIYRHRYEEGQTVFKACVVGTKEVGGAVFMSTLTTAAVFLPVLMLKGEVGTLFGPVAFIISAAIFLSLFDAFTVVPMLASRWMKEVTEPGGFVKRLMAPLFLLDKIGNAVSNNLIKFLKFFLAHQISKILLVVSVLGLFAISCWMLPGMGYLPTGGTNLIKVQIAAAEGTCLDENSRLMQILEKRWNRIKGVKTIVEVPNRDITENVIYIVCEREEDSGVSVQQIAKQAHDMSTDLPFKYVNPIQFPLFGNIDTRSNIIDLRVVGESYKVIEPLVRSILDIGKNIDGIVFSYTDLALRTPEVQVRIDPERTAKFGFQPKDVADAVEAAGGGQQTTTQYDVNGQYFYINVMGQERCLQTVEDAKQIILTSPQNSNVQVPLTSVASVETTFGPLQIDHFNSNRAATIQFTIQGRSLSEVFHELNDKVSSLVALPVGYSIVPFGAVKQLSALEKAIMFVFPLSVVVVYLLLVMQFQSFIRPLSIMLSVPLSIMGANMLVNVTGVHFDSFTMLGYIMMVGLVVKNAIILITYAIQLIDSGIDRDEALTLASQRRMRPIFMTAISMVLGMLPLALKNGAGAEIYNGLAMAVVGGLSVATLFTLIFIPVVYTILDDVKSRFWKIEPLNGDF